MPKPPFTLGEHDTRRDTYPLLLHGRQVTELYFNLRGYRGSLPLPTGTELDIGEKNLKTYNRAIKQVNDEWRGVTTWYEITGRSCARRCFGTNYARAQEHLKALRDHHIAQEEDHGNWWYALVEVTLQGNVRYERDVQEYQGKGSQYQMQCEARPFNPSRYAF